MDVGGLAMMMDPFTKDNFIKIWDKEEEEYSIQLARFIKAPSRPTLSKALAHLLAKITSMKGAGMGERCMVLVKATGTIRMMNWSRLTKVSIWMVWNTVKESIDGLMGVCSKGSGRMDKSKDPTRLKNHT